MAVNGPRIGIRELRKAHGLSLPQLAQRIKDESGIDVKPDSLSNIELGHRRASDALLIAWVKALGLHPLDVEQAAPGQVAA